MNAPKDRSGSRLGHSTASAQCPNCPRKRKSIRPLAMSQKCQKQSFDQLVGAAKQRQRDGQAERLGGLEVDDELNFCGLLDR
jgi:hypothetical protein